MSARPAATPTRVLLRLFVATGCLLARAEAAAAAAACHAPVADTDTMEKYYHKTAMASAALCCTACAADKQCAFAVFDQPTCYLKDAATMTPVKKSGRTLLVVRSPPPPPPSPSPTALTPLSLFIINWKPSLCGP